MLPRTSQQSLMINNKLLRVVVVEVKVLAEIMVLAVAEILVVTANTSSYRLII